ncbi:XkdX family protein [Eggerthellaceae bacterium zg-893]|nr:XkdX family protein [Eggerthellaceae bacterium zg-893]
MNEIWANRLIAGTKKWEQVPASRKEAVAAVLEGRVESGVLSEERRLEIVGG